MAGQDTWNVSTFVVSLRSFVTSRGWHWPYSNDNSLSPPALHHGAFSRDLKDQIMDFTVSLATWRGGVAFGPGSASNWHNPKQSVSNAGTRRSESTFMTLLWNPLNSNTLSRGKLTGRGQVMNVNSMFKLTRTRTRSLGEARNKSIIISISGTSEVRVCVILDMEFYEVSGKRSHSRVWRPELEPDDVNLRCGNVLTEKEAMEPGRRVFVFPVIRSVGISRVVEGQFSRPLEKDEALELTQEEVGRFPGPGRDSKRFRLKVSHDID